ncbi:MAG TPA: thioredoxin family protein [Myxococcales bacterium]|nr:thioredoxin family protein [Myxococcales bacterium]
MDRSWIGGLALLLAVAFGALLWFDVGGVQTKLFAEPGAKARVVVPKFPAAPPAATPSGEITPAWFLGANGYDGAELERQSARAPLIVYFQKKSCDACRRFEKDVLAATEVKAFLGGVVKVRVDPDDGDREQRLAHRFGVAQVPAVLVVPPQGPPRLLPGTALKSPRELIAFAR